MTVLITDINSLMSFYLHWPCIPLSSCQIKKPTGKGKCTVLLLSSLIHDEIMMFALNNYNLTLFQPETRSVHLKTHSSVYWLSVWLCPVPALCKWVALIQPLWVKSTCFFFFPMARTQILYMKAFLWHGLHIECTLKHAALFSEAM